MTALTVTSAMPIDLQSILSQVFNLNNLVLASPSQDSVHGFRVTLPGYILDFGGSGFVYPDTSGNDLPTAGTIQSFTIYQPSGDPSHPTELLSLAGFSMTLAQLEGYLGQGGESALMAALFSGDDSATFTAQNFNPATTIDGGPGTDTVTINGSSSQPIQMLDTSLQNIEILNLGSPSFNHSGAPVLCSLTVVMADGNVAAGNSMTVFDDLGKLGKLTFDASAELDGNYTVYAGDTATGGGTDVVTTGGGDDTIIVVDKQVVIEAGTGNDTVDLGQFAQARALNANDAIDGGSDPSGMDVDTLVFNSGGRILNTSGSGYHTEVDRLGASTVTNFEVFKFMNGANDAPGANGIYSVIANDATVAAGKTLTVDASSLSAANINFDGSAETDGQFKFIGSQSDPVLNPGAIDVFTGGANADAFDFAGSSAALANLSGGAGNDTFEFTSNAFEAATKAGGERVAADYVDGGDGNDALVISGDYTAPLIFEGASAPGAASPHKGTLTSIEQVTLGTGNNYNFVLADMKDTGTSFDATALTASNFVHIDGSQVVHDSLSLLGGAGNDTLVGGSNNDVLNGGAGQDTIDMSSGGKDTVDGGAGNDMIIAGASFNGGDQIDGGDGDDGLSLDGNYGALGAAVVLAGTSWVSLETVTLAAGTKATGNLGYYFQLVDGAVTSTETDTLTIDGHGLTSRDVMSIDGSHVHGGSLVLIGGPSADTLAGGALGDTIEAGDGVNTITGGGGADLLSGGSGVDQYFYNAVNDSTVRATGNAFDTITNFDLAHDRLHFADLVVTAVDNAVAGHTVATSPTSMANALTADLAGLQAGHAVLYDGLDGHVYLVVNAHGTTGFHVNADYVIDITGALHSTTFTTGGLTLADFV